MSEVTRILSAIEQGDPHAADQLLPLVYDALRKLAAHKLAREAPGQTLQATALVHEAYLRLVASPGPELASPGRELASPGRKLASPGRKSGEVRFANRGHFFSAAAEAMRRILVENARRKASSKRGGGRKRVGLELVVSVDSQPAEDMLALDEALGKLGEEDPKKAALVKLRYFAGLSVQEAADALGISRATADRYWAYARVWLYAAIHGRARDSDP
jgi:RNA polymerase sigma factor (sigma-70 family)